MPSPRRPVRRALLAIRPVRRALLAIRPVRRALLVVVSMLLAGTAFTLTLTAVAVPAAFADTPTSEPLLLVHGFNDHCRATWDTAPTPGHQNAGQTTVGYLQGAGFTDIDEVGYYTNSANSTDPQDWTAQDTTCNENLNALPPKWNQNANLCNLVATNSTDYGTKNDHIDRLGCLLAWYIWNKYSQYGRPVNVLAHSMGGLIVRDAIGRTAAHAANFPPQALWVPRVVTVATPHAGIGGLYRTFANMDSSTNGLELDDMEPGSTFMNMIGGMQRPQGAGGTNWSLMGAADGPYYDNPLTVLCQGGITVGYPIDGGNAVSCITGDPGDVIVPLSSAMGMQANYKIAYGVKDCTRINCALSGLDVADLQTQYEHEVGMPCIDRDIVHLCFNNYPYYLNDSTSTGTMAFVCGSGCNDSSIPGGDAVAASRSLTTIVNRLKVAASPPTLSSQSLVIRSTNNNNYVSAELGYTGSSYAMMRARAATKGSWEAWTEVFLPNGGVAIKSNANGLYAAVEVDYTGSTYGELRARSAVVGPENTFDVSTNSDGSYSIKSRLNALFVSAEMGYTGSNYAMLRARAGSVGPWEKFTQNTGPGGCTDYGGPDITGPNGCVGFHTQAPPGKPASGNVWFSSVPYGYKGQEIWTYANGTVATSTAVYQLSGLDTIHVMTLQAWVPDHTSDAQHAHYHYCSPGGGCADGYVNQAANTNVWVTFGAVCTTDGTATITLADDGGDTYPRAVGADAVRAIRTGGIIC